MATVSRLAPFFLFVLWGCNEPIQVTDEDPELGYTTTYTLHKESRLPHGLYMKTDSAGIVLEKGNMFQGQLHGIRELYYPDGKVKVRERYVMGQIDDLYEYFYADGKVELQGYYIDGAMYGLWKKFSNEGSLQEEVTMIANEEMGPFKEYYPNGTIQAEGNYLHGPNEDGVLKLYDESGQLQKEMFCDSGRCYTIWPKL